MKFEFISIQKASIEVEWLQNLLSGTPLWLNPSFVFTLITKLLSFELKIKFIMIKIDNLSKT